MPRVIHAAGALTPSGALPSPDIFSVACSTDGQWHSVLPGYIPTSPSLSADTAPVGHWCFRWFHVVRDYADPQRTLGWLGVAPGAHTLPTLFIGQRFAHGRLANA